MLIDKVNGLSVYIGELTTLEFLSPTLHNVFLYLGVEKKQFFYTKKDLKISILENLKTSILISVNNNFLRITEDSYQINNGALISYDEKLCLVNLVLKFIRLAYLKKITEMDVL